MKKSIVFLLVTQLCALNGMHENLKNDLDRRAILPEKKVVIRSIGRFGPANLPEKTGAADLLALQNKSQREVREILQKCSTRYFKNIDQPTGREHFESYINQIAHDLVNTQYNLNNPATPQHSCKLHAHLKTHESLNRAPTSKL